MLRNRQLLTFFSELCQEGCLSEELYRRDRSRHNQHPLYGV